MSASDASAIGQRDPFDDEQVIIDVKEANAVRLLSQNGGRRALASIVEGWKAAVDKFKETFPPETWAHFREDEDGRWQIIEKGVTPPGWRVLSMSSDLFAVQFEEPFEVGDRFVIGEEPWEMVDGVHGREMRRITCL